MSTFEETERYVKSLIKDTFGVDVDTNISVDLKGMVCNIEPVNDKDRATLIGKYGDNIKAVRRLAKVWGKRNNIALQVYVRFDYQK